MGPDKIQKTDIPKDIEEEPHLQEDPVAADVTSFIKEAIGTASPLADPEVDITLHPSREIPIAGELWSVTGHVFNRSTRPIWITDTATILSLSPEMYGQNSQIGSIDAFFPTTKSGQKSDIVRIDPKAEYTVIWKINPSANAFSKIWNAICNYAFFNPGQFRMNATVHIWNLPPKTDKDGLVINLGDSFSRSESKSITMDASPWVLIAGAAIGGILCYILQILSGSASFGSGFLQLVKGVFVGLTSAILLCGVVTVLLSRLATTNFILVVKIQDLWGAIATGFTIQWFGFSLLQKIMN